jgi:hypothetical protein
VGAGGEGSCLIWANYAGRRSAQSKQGGWPCINPARDILENESIIVFVIVVIELKANNKIEKYEEN